MPYVKRFEKRLLIEDEKDFSFPIWAPRISFQQRREKKWYVRKIFATVCHRFPRHAYTEKINKTSKP